MGTDKTRISNINKIKNWISRSDMDLAFLIAQICMHSGCRIRTAKEYLKVLEDIGFIQIAKDGKVSRKV